MKERPDSGLALVGALAGTALFFWMANWPQPSRMSRPWFFYLAELMAVTVIMGCGFAALFAPIAKSLDLEESACEMVGYVLTVIGFIGTLDNRKPLWADCLILIGFPVGKLCRRWAYPSEEADASVPYPAAN